MENKKAQSLSINTIIIAVLALLVLVVLVIIFTSNTNNLGTGINTQEMSAYATQIAVECGDAANVQDCIDGKDLPVTVTPVTSLGGTNNKAECTKRNGYNKNLGATPTDYCLFRK